MPQTFYEVIWIFIIYAFLGWCSEVAYAATEKGIFVNRGFLNGPYCPIYGFGVLIIVVILTPLKDNLLILFIGSFFLTSILEYFTGLILEKAFHNKWWDYSDKPFNIKGYVCLKFSILWGLACSFIMLVLHPVIYRFIKMIPYLLGNFLLSIILICLSVDITVTVSTIIKLNRRLELLNDIAGKLKEISNEIGENVYENVMDVIEKRENFEESHIEMMEEIEKRKKKIREDQKELIFKYRELFEHRNMVSSRLMKAFPNMKSVEHNEILEKLKKFDSERK